MSRVLRRPMFRGGIADSDGLGITSGLMEPRQGYANGDFVARNPAEQARYEFLKKRLETYNPAEEAKKRLQSEITAVDPIYYLGDPREATPRYTFLAGPQGLPYIEEQIKKEYEPLEREFAQYKLQPKQSVASLGFTKTDDIKQDDTNVKLKATETKTEQPIESDTDVMNRYMEMFKANLAGDKDELKSQRYFELAKFGLNLLSQPGGPPGGKRDLLGAVGRAGVPAIEGLSRISAEEKAAERQAKILGFQAALRELENPSLKKIQTLSKLTGVPVSEIAKKELAESAQASNVRQNIIERYASVLQSKDPESNLKIAEEIVGMGKNLTQFQKHKDPNILTGKEKKDQYYYFENPGPGGELVGKWDGKKFLVPGDEGF
jgi:hypothetical protein